MLIVGEKLIDMPVLSLQTGTEIARTDEPVIDPANLNIIAYKLQGRLLSDKTQDSYMRTAEIREYSPLGLIVDSSDEILLQEDVIKDKNIYELKFSPIGLKVIDENNRRLGKVTGYTVSIPSFSILQLKVARGGLALITETEKLIHRSQIVAIDDTTVTVKTTAHKLKDVTPIINTEPIINPFRSNKPSQEMPSSFSDSSTS